MTGFSSVGRQMKLLSDAGYITRTIWVLLLLSTVVSLGLARWSIAFVSFATFALTLVPPIIASRWQVSLPRPFLLATTLFIVCSIFLGEAFDFYEQLPWWDVALHGFSAVGFGMMGFLFVFMLFEGDKFAAPPSALAYISFCVGMTVGGTWEIFEFAMDQIFGMNMQKSGLVDTMWDLIVDALGSLIASLAGYFYLKGWRTGIFGRSVNAFVLRNRGLYQRFRDRLDR
jgi:hypothetical protein